MTCWHRDTKNLWPWVLVIDALLTEDDVLHLASYRRLWVGFSGGLDSTVLLHYLSHHTMLSANLRALHVHHGLHANADDWQKHCERLCAVWQVPLVCRSVTLLGRSNLEEKARLARYQVFASLLDKGDALLLAHHGNDQAETLLLHLLRGTGIDGLAAMPMLKPFANGHVIRPFLKHTRPQLEAYALRHMLSFVEDDSNEDTTLSRNYVRHHILPLLQEKWPSAVSQMMRTAQHCQQAKKNLGVLANLDCPTRNHQPGILALASLHGLDDARVTNVLRHWWQENGLRPPSEQTLYRLIHEVIAARDDANPKLLFGDVEIRRYQQRLYCVRKEDARSFSDINWSFFPRPLVFSGYSLSAIPDHNGVWIPEGAVVQVRFRSGGEELYWHGQHKSLKKLLQLWHVPPWQRDTIPLIYVNGELAAVVGYATNDRYLNQDGEACYRMEWVGEKYGSTIN